VEPTSGGTGPDAGDDHRVSSRTDASQQGSSRLADTSRLHFRVGWWSLLLFLTLGLILEALHGFKVGFYLDVSNSTRRLMWTLAHVHGTLLSILNLVLAISIRLMPDWKGPNRTLASRCLLGALGLMPLGFFLGGIFTYGGDPGIGVILVPPGGLLLFLSVLLTARASGAWRR
jgi:hypothetical protein